MDYPPTRRDDVVEVLHGVEVHDPYRWLEDTASDETRAWVKQQNELTASYLERLPAREEIRSQLEELWDVPRRSAPVPRGGRWFQLRNTGLQPQPVLWVMPEPDAEGQVLLDPNQLSDDGTVALVEWAVSRDGRLLAYATSDGGSDWMTWRIRDIGTGRDHDDVLEWSKFSTAVWSPNADSLFYSAYDAPTAGRELLDENRTPRIVRHRLGTAQSDDALVFARPEEPGWGLHLDVTDDGRFLVVVVTKGTAPEQQLHVVDLTDAAAGVRPLVADFASEADIVGSEGSTFLLLTDWEAPRRRIVAVDLASPSRDEWREVVPETTDTLLQATVAGGRVLCHYLRDAHSVLHVSGGDGAAGYDVELPPYVSVTEISARAESPVVHFAVSSFTDPGSVWRHDVATGETARVFATAVDNADLVTEQAFVDSGGARIPVFLVHRRDVVPARDVPTLLYGYGGFNIPVTPAFAAARALWAKRGGLYAVACLRGGGEYGRDWHDAGRLANKQNVFDDFCAVAGWLAGPSGWSRRERIAIHGGSNGGLLVGACLTQHPELFGAAAAAVGVLDMLRFHKFTIGWAWTSDYGSPEDPEQFRWLYAYSPLHNVRPGVAYPSTLVLTGDHDDRVAPGHSYKFTAALQAAQEGNAPILLRVETSAGHGAGKPTQKLVEEGADLVAFLEAAVGHPAIDV